MKKTMLLVLLSVSFLMLFIFISCGPDGKSGTSALVTMSDEAPGENCVAGGTRVDTGLDMNDNKELDEDEITDTRYVCENTNGVDGEKGDPGKDGAACVDCADGAKGDQGVDGVCAGNTAPVINSITINGKKYAEEPILSPFLNKFAVSIDATDADADDSLAYSISGGFVDIVDKADGNYTFTSSIQGVFHFTAIVSDGCQMVMKNFSVLIGSIVYSGADRNLVYDKDATTNPVMVDLFDSEGIWDDMYLDLTIDSPTGGTQPEYRFGIMYESQETVNNNVEFAVDVDYDDSAIQNFPVGTKIHSSLYYSKYSGIEFSMYSDYGGDIIENGGFINNATGYAGLKFTDIDEDENETNYYGWIQVAVTDYDNANIKGTLIDWAYDSKPENPILAGQKE